MAEMGEVSKEEEQNGSQHECDRFVPYSDRRMIICRWWFDGAVCIAARHGWGDSRCRISIL